MQLTLIMQKANAALSVAVSGSRPDKQYIQLPRFMMQDFAQNLVRKRTFPQLPHVCFFLSRAEAEEFQKERLHPLNHLLRIKRAREAQSLLHFLFSCRKKRHFTAGHQRPAGLLLVIDQHALQHHLLPRKRLLNLEEVFGAAPPQL